MSFWLEFLPIVIYILLIIILIVGIILGIRFIVLLGKAQKVVDDVNEKVKSLDGLFHIIDTATDKVVLVTDKVIDVIMNFISKIFMKSETEKEITTKKRGKEKMSKKCGFGTFLTGALVGAGLGILFAPKTGSETREDLKNKIEELKKQLDEIDYNEVKDKLLDKIEELKEELKDLDKEKAIKLAKQKASQIEKKVEEIIELAKEKGTPVVEKAAQEVKEKTVEVLKEVLDRLEKPEETKKKTTKSKKVVAKS